MGLLAAVLFVALLLLALIALVPLRRPPLSKFSFAMGFLPSELAVQMLTAALVLAAVIDWIGWPNNLLGTIGLMAAAVTVGIDTSLLTVSLRARRVVEQALADARGLEIPAERRPAWLRWWRTFFAVPLGGRRVTIHRDLAYMDDGDAAHLLDVIVPAGGATDAPVLLFVHGGAWTIGSKREQGLPMLFELASQGWVCVSCNYRLSPKATWPDHVVDVKRAIAWVKENVATFGGDAEKFLGISGASAGGHLAALAALTPDDAAWQPGFEDVDTSVDACVSLYGVLEMTGDRSFAGAQGSALESHLARAVIKATLESARTTYEAASPMHRIADHAPPFIILHGTKDTLVPVGVARAFVRAYGTSTTAPLCYVELPWAQHAFDLACSPRCSATTMGIVRFLDAVVASRAQRPVV